MISLVFLLTATLENVNGTKYENILRGSLYYQDGILNAMKELFGANVSNHDLEKISFRLKDFVHQIQFEDRNSHRTEYYGEGESVFSPNATLPMHIGYKDSRTICFTRNSDSNAGIQRRFDAISFPLQKLIDTRLYMSIYIHHPGQLTRSLDKPIVQSRASAFEENRKVIFNINQVSVLRRRPDAIKKCDKELFDDDEKFRSQIIRTVGCRPSYWNNFGKDSDLLNECKTASEMAQVYTILEKYKSRIFDSYWQPCNYMTILTGLLQTNAESTYKSMFLVLEFVYRDEFYQEIVNLKEFGFESFWSGVGGFVGIFLGYSLLQIPDLVQGLWASNTTLKMKEWWVSKIMRRTITNISKGGKPTVHPTV